MGRHINIDVFFFSILFTLFGCISTPEYPSEPQDPSFISGIVLTPDGAPAEGARFTLLTEGPQQLYYPDFPDDVFGRREKEKLEIYSIGKDGKFKIPRPKKKYLTIAFVHESGCRQFSYKEKPWPYVIKLKAWGSVKGRMRANSKPIPNEEIGLYAISAFGMLTTKTDENGFFEFEYVPPFPAQIWVTHRLLSHLLKRPHVTYLNVNEGECTEIDINAMGATLKGTVRMPDGSKLQQEIADKLDVSNLWFIRPISPPPAEFLNEDWDGMSTSERNKWFSRIHCTVEGWKMMGDMKITDDICIMFDEKTHTISGKTITPGVYELILGDIDGKIGHIFRIVNVPDLPPEELAKTVIDLGEMRILPPCQKPKVGKKAPPFFGEDLNGNQVLLNDFKGKFVVLVFSLETYFLDDKGEQIPTQPSEDLQKLYEKYRTDNRIEFVMVFPRENKTELIKLLKTNKLKWKTLILEEENRSNHSTLDRYGTVSEFYRYFLIRPDRTIGQIGCDCIELNLEKELNQSKDR